MLADAARAALASAEPGSGFQLAWARAFSSSARRPEDLAVVRGWLGGVGVPPGLAIDTDRTASGERLAALAHALVPTAESKAETWRRLTGDEQLRNWLQRSLLQGFHHSSQLELTEPYRAKFFDVVDDIWATRDNEPAQEFVFFAYPSSHVSDDTVALTDAWLAVEGHPAPLRRLVAEGKDGVVRALAARAKDAASA
jgi:aminopeptidase N